MSLRNAALLTTPAKTSHFSAVNTKKHVMG